MADDAEILAPEPRLARGTRAALAPVAMLMSYCMMGCSERVDLGSDLLWSADMESADLRQWTQGEADAVSMPGGDTIVEVTSEHSHRGRHAVKLVNPAAWDNEELGPELIQGVGASADAYYSAWFMLPEDYRVEPALTLLHLRSREGATGEALNGEQLRLRSLPGGGYVLLVFHNHASFLQEPVADPAPHVAAGRWFHLEARYQPQSAGRLRVWLDGILTYDLSGRPGAAASEVVLSAGNVVERSEPAPLTLFVDDAAISLSRVTPGGHLELD